MIKEMGSIYLRNILQFMNPIDFYKKTHFSLELLQHYIKGSRLNLAQGVSIFGSTYKRLTLFTSTLLF